MVKKTAIYQKGRYNQSFDNDGADFFGTGYSYPEDLERTILNMKTPMFTNRILS